MLAYGSCLVKGKWIPSCELLALSLSNHGQPPFSALNSHAVWPLLATQRILIDHCRACTQEGDRWMNRSSRDTVLSYEGGRESVDSEAPPDSESSDALHSFLILFAATTAYSHTDAPELL